MTHLARSLGVVRGLGLTLGVAVGSGIFVLPAYVATLLTDPADFLRIWWIGGLLSLATALCYAELSTTFPETGGYLVFVRRIFGDRLAFLYGWAAMFVLWPSSIAGLARVFSASVRDLLGLPGESALLAVAVIAAGAAVNAVGVGTSSRVQVGMTFLKVSLLVALVVVAFVGGGGSGESPGAPQTATGEGASASAWFLGLVAVFWCYEGFLEIVAVAGEVRRPGRTLLWVLAGGVLLITALYCGLAWALVHRLGMAEVVGHGAVAAELARRLVGSSGGQIVSAGVALATSSAVLSLLFSGPRILVAMADAGLFFPRAGGVGSRGTPWVAVGILALGACAYASVGTFVELVKYFSFATGLFSLLIVGGGAWLRMRGRIPVSCRRIPFWPLPVVLSVAATAGALFYVWRDQPRASNLGLLLLLLALPVSGWVRRAMVARTVPAATASRGEES